VVAENTPSATFLTKIGNRQSAGCQLCRISPREARGESTDGLAAEAHGHIMATVQAAAKKWQ